MSSYEIYKTKIKAALADVYGQTYSWSMLQTLDDAMIAAMGELFHERAQVLKEAGDWDQPVERVR